MRFYGILLVCSCYGLFGCQSFDFPAVEGVAEIKPAAQQTQQSLTKEFENKLALLVDELIAPARFDYKNKPILITTFVWSDTLTYKTSSPRSLQLLGHQVAEGLMTKLVQRGGKVIEHLSAKSISVSKKASYFLTRDTKQLRATAKADYVIAGTVTEVENGAIVNAEVIEISSSQIVSASRQYFASSYLWPDDKMTTIRNGLLYRQ